jgi:hypothetical protein
MSADTLVAREDGFAYVRWGYQMENEPGIRWLYFPLGIKAAAIRIDWGRELPLPLVSLGEGLYREKPEPGRLTFRLEHGGSTKSAFEETEPIPAPKARGKELRWHRGHWEKYLKREGWVAA